MFLKNFQKTFWNCLKNSRKSLNNNLGVLLEWDGIGGADQYRIVDDETGEANFINDNTYWAPMNPGNFNL